MDAEHSRPTFNANGIVTLTTDFGLRDPYVGVMKGVILGRNPHAKLVDLTHEIPVYQPRSAGFWLACCHEYFPAGTVHLAVVDPGVGTERRMLLLIMAGQVFIAPDNGLLETVPGTGSAQTIWRQFTCDDLAHLHLPEPSHTFHGRDIFAPLVAELSAGRLLPSLLGSEFTDMAGSTPVPSTEALVAGEVTGQIVWVDHYGNLLTDLRAASLNHCRRPGLRYGQHLIPILPSYGFASTGGLLGVVNSWGRLEIAESHGNAMHRLQARVGDQVTLTEFPEGNPTT